MHDHRHRRAALQLHRDGLVVDGVVVLAMEDAAPVRRFPIACWRPKAARRADDVGKGQYSGASGSAALDQPPASGKVRS